MKGEKAVQAFDIMRKGQQLPTKIEDLVPLSLVGHEAVKFYRNLVKNIDELKMSVEQKEATLRNGQEIGEMLLDIETRIGQLLPSREESIKRAQKIGTEKARVKGGRSTVDLSALPKPLPEGLTSARAKQARKIAENPEIVERIKKEAREKDDIPTKRSVLSAIGYEREKEAKVERKKALAVLKIEEQTFIMRLEQCVRELTNQKPPKDWSKEGFDFAIALCKVITRRLSPFLETKQFKESVLRSKIEQVYYVED